MDITDIENELNSLYKSAKRSIEKGLSFDVCVDIYKYIDFIDKNEILHKIAIDIISVREPLSDENRNLVEKTKYSIVKKYDFAKKFIDRSNDLELLKLSKQFVEYSDERQTGLPREFDRCRVMQSSLHSIMRRLEQLNLTNEIFQNENWLFLNKKMDECFKLLFESERKLSLEAILEPWGAFIKLNDMHTGIEEYRVGKREYDDGFYASSVSIIRDEFDELRNNIKSNYRWVFVDEDWGRILDLVQKEFVKRLENQKLYFITKKGKKFFYLNKLINFDYKNPPRYLRSFIVLFKLQPFGGSVSYDECLLKAKELGFSDILEKKDLQNDLTVYSSSLYRNTGLPAKNENSVYLIKTDRKQKGFLFNNSIIINNN